uniref:Probable receptor-like protein kinase At5g24010 isoform X1 n=1 Tax=Nelumbo nucifera TaxID=4432 RepID=A0A1U8ATV5_NELNU
MNSLAPETESVLTSYCCGGSEGGREPTQSTTSSMGKPQSHRILLLLLLCFSLFFHLSSSYTLPTEYFINCGSHADVFDVETRRFVGDKNSNSFTLLATSDNVVGVDNSPPDLYSTARIFRKPSAYEFNIDGNRTHVVRLHFSPFTSQNPNYNSTSAVFNVSVAGFSLLTKFGVNDSTTEPLIKEFLLSINSTKFQIIFKPEASFAFVNAIEVFLAPDILIPNKGPLYINSTGSSKAYNGLPSKVLETIYRINVGGSKITPTNDTLWRTWIPDVSDNHSYLVNPNPEATNTPPSKSPKYQEGDMEYVAPHSVYSTARQPKNNNSNITWSFSVSPNAKHLVRLHFCDIVSESTFLLSFYAYINTYYGYIVNDTTAGLLVPNHTDFVVDSGDSGTIKIIVGPDSSSAIKTVFLNGLEIMEITNNRDTSFLHGFGKKNHVVIVVASVVGGIAVIGVLVVAVFIFIFRCRRQKTPSDSKTWPPLSLCEGSSYTDMNGGSTNGSPFPNLDLSLKIPFTDILFATNNFSKVFLIGSGGFGKVYRGILRDNTKVAVKRSQQDAGQGFLEFQTEIMVLSRIRHRHLVSLVGYCDEHSEMILVYEFMERGTLRDHLYGSELPCLSWKQRLEICIGSARGLHYLHTGAAGKIIHRDVKSTNILLDGNFVAKVADFGLSKAGPGMDETHVSTAVKGSFGYLDPEYFKRQQLTDKSDVYSFGVVLLEVICARPAINPTLPREQVNLAQWGMNCLKKGSFEQIIDPFLVGKISPDSLRKFGDIVQKCLSEYGFDRPTMGDVLWDLEYALKLQQTAVHREPHEDSIICASEHPLPTVQRVPSINVVIERDGVVPKYDISSDVSESQVFSQLTIGEGR